MQVQPPQHIYIKATMLDSTSVLMAEAATSALAATVTERLHLQQTNFLTDNQELVLFLNASDHSNPPDWRIKHFTQLFVNYTKQRTTEIFKISRNLNQTADTLARQAVLDSGVHHSELISYLFQQCSCISMSTNSCITISSHKLCNNLNSYMLMK